MAILPHSFVRYECNHNGLSRSLIMTSDIDPVTTDNDTTNIIVKICSMVTVLKHQSDTEEIHKLKKIVSGGETVQTEIDIMLGPDGPKRFLKNLSKGENTIRELLDLYAVPPIEIPNKKEIEGTLKDLKRAMENLRQKVDPLQN